MNTLGARRALFVGVLGISGGFFFACGTETAVAPIVDKEGGANDGSNGADGRTYADGSTVTTVRAVDYDQSCTLATDCEIVASGDVCACGWSCGYAVLSKSALSSYRAEVDRLQRLCPPTGGNCPGIMCVNPGKTQCTAGKCSLSSAIGDAGNEGG